MTLSKRYRFRRAARLKGGRAFQAIFDDRVGRSVGPLRCYGRLNGLSYCRLGLSVSRRVGNAVTRHRLKRQLREAFRLVQPDLPGGLDIVVVVRAHEPLALTMYEQLLCQAIGWLDRFFKRRRRLSDERTDDS